MTGLQKVVFVVLFLCCAFAATNAGLTYLWVSGSSDPGWTDGRQGGKVIVLQVLSGGGAPAPRFGDEILLLNGRAVGPDFSIHYAFEGLPAGAGYSMRVLRDGREVELILHTQRFSLLIRLTAFLAVMAVPLLFLIFAFLLALFSQGDRRALLLACAFAMTVPEVPFFSLADAPAWAVMIMVLGRPLTYLAFPLYFRFCLVYPEESPLLRRWPWLRKKRYLFAPYVPLGLLSLWIAMKAYVDPPAAFRLRTSPLGFLARFGVIIVYLLAAFYAIRVSYRQAGDVIRTKLRLICWGLAVGFALIVLRSLALFALGLMPNGVQSWVGQTALDAFTCAAFVMLSMLPVLLVFAVTTHELVPLKEPAKRAAKVAFIRGLSYVVFGLILGTSTYLALYLPDENFRRTGWGWRVGVVLFVLATTYYAVRAVAWAEKKYVNVYVRSLSTGLAAHLDNDISFRAALLAFYRKAARRLKIGPSLSARCDEVQGVIRDASYPKEFASTLARKALEIFPADKAAVFVENTSKGCYEPLGYETRGGRASPLTGSVLPSDSRVVALLKQKGKPLAPSALLHGMGKGTAATGDADRTALATLKKLDPTILLPANHDDQLPLIISLGRERRFSRREKRALKRLSRLAAVESEFASWRKVIESSDLKVVLENLLVAAVRSIRPAQRGTIYLWDDSLQKLVIYAQYRYKLDIVRKVELGRGEGFAGRAFERNERFIVDNFQKDERGANIGVHQITEIKSAMFIPFQAWGRTIGILCLDNVESIGAFEPKHMRRVERFGSMVSLAVQNARVQTELRRVGSRLDDVSCEGILDSVFKSVASFTEVKAANLLLVMDPRESAAVHEQKPLLSLARGFKDDRAFCESFTPQPDGMTAAALKSLKDHKDGNSDHPREIKYGSPDDPPIRNRAGLDYGIRASVCFPFQVSEFVAGMLFFNYFSPHSFQDSEVEALRLFANEAALGIANTLKREELQYIDQVVWMALLISGLQHDMNQFTGVIDNDLRTLDDIIKTSAPKGEDEELALRAVSRIRDSVVLIQSHQESIIDAWKSDFTSLDLSALVTEVATRGCRANSKVRLDISDFQDGPECWVSAIPRQLQLVLKNLVSNAVRATRTSPSPSLVIRKKVSGRRVELSITNTGKPIPAETRMRMFKEIIPNHEFKRTGHGIGLWIGRRVIRRHGGDLDLAKSDETGTTFALWLPLTDAKAPAPRNRSEVVYEQV